MAKDAILNLLPYEIKFEDLVAEGVGANTLADLYKELDLSVPSQWRSPKLVSQTRHRKSSESTHSGQRDAIEEAAPSQHRDGQKAALSMSETQATDTPIGVAPSDGAMLMRNNRVLKTSQNVTATNGVEPPQLSASSTLHSTKKNATNVRLPDPNSKAKSGQAQLERKDLILQKLAAKRGLAKPQSTDNHKPSTHVVKSPLNSKPSDSRVAGSENEKDAQQPSGQPGQQIHTPTPGTDTTLSTAPEQSAHAAYEIGRDSTATENMDKSKASEEDSNAVPSPGKTAPTLHSSTSIMPPSASSKMDPSSPQMPQTQGDAPTATPPFSGIPGLFMTSMPDSNTKSPQLSRVQPPSTLGQTPTPSRKRPVAADFDTGPPNITGGPKRRFGQSRAAQALVIDVSEDESVDEDGDEGMDVEGNGASQQPTRSASAVEPRRHPLIRDMPPLPDFPGAFRPPTRKSTFAQNTASSTPPISLKNKGMTTAHMDLKRREQEIQLMQRKIAELELRKTLLGKSRAQTPSNASALPPPEKSTDFPVAERPLSPADIDRLIQDTSQQFQEKSDELDAANVVAAAEKEKASQARTELKNRRLAELKSGLSLSEVEVEKEKIKLEELRKEFEKREALVRDAIMKKQKLEAELHRLDFDEMSSLDDSVQAQEEVFMKDGDVQKDPGKCSQQS